MSPKCFDRSVAETLLEVVRKRGLVSTAKCLLHATSTPPDLAFALTEAGCATKARPCCMAVMRKPLSSSAVAFVSWIIMSGESEFTMNSLASGQQETLAVVTATV